MINVIFSHFFKVSIPRVILDVSKANNILFSISSSLTLPIIELILWLISFSEIDVYPPR